MISPETFIKTYENKNYNQLLTIRQSLMDNVRALGVAKSGDVFDNTK